MKSLLNRGDAETRSLERNSSLRLRASAVISLT
jgi:hypothetical protein